MQTNFLSLITRPRPKRPKGPPCVPQSDAALTGRAADLLRGAGCTGLAARVTVSWHRRLTSTAGLAQPSHASVLLNPRLQAFPDEIDRTLRHELAHLVAYDRARGRQIAAHGKEWKQACNDLGIPGESRCHTLPLPRRQINRRHLYRCPRCHFVLRRVRPIKTRRRLACHECCKAFAKGRFDARFEFVKVASPHPAYGVSRIETIVQQTLNFLFPDERKHEG